MENNLEFFICTLIDVKLIRLKLKVKRFNLSLKGINVN